MFIEHIYQKSEIKKENIEINYIYRISNLIAAYINDKIKKKRHLFILIKKNSINFLIIFIFINEHIQFFQLFFLKTTTRLYPKSAYKRLSSVTFNRHCSSRLMSAL